MTPIDIANGVIVGVALVLMVVAAITLMRVGERLSGRHSVLWLLLIVVVPFVGPIVWLAVGLRRARAAEPPTSR